MADQKVSELTALTAPAAEDLLLIIDDPNGTPLSKSVTYKNLFADVTANVSISAARTTFAANTLFTGTTANCVANLHCTGVIQADLLQLPTSNTISSAAATGVKGDVRWSAGFLYVCVATNTWQRVAIATW